MKTKQRAGKCRQAVYRLKAARARAHRCSAMHTSSGTCWCSRDSTWVTLAGNRLAARCWRRYRASAVCGVWCQHVIADADKLESALSVQVKMTWLAHKLQCVCSNGSRQTRRRHDATGVSQQQQHKMHARTANPLWHTQPASAHNGVMAPSCIFRWLGHQRSGGPGNL